MELRGYQKDLISDIYKEWGKGHQRVLAQLPTGGGKTVVFSAIAKDAIDKGQRVLVLAHREELILQAASKLRHATSESVGIIKSGFPFEPIHNMQVASVQTLVNKLDVAGDFDLIVIDEAHHAAANTYQKILDRYPTAKKLGVTATPARLSGKGLADIFDSLVCSLSVKELIVEGYLCPFVMYADSAQMVTKGVKSVGGDYSAKQLAEVNDATYLAGYLVETYKKLAAMKKAIVFAINVEHSIAIASAYNQAGVPAAHLDGDSKLNERSRILSDFANGEIKVVCNVGLFTEGLDLPCVEVVQVARPTKSISLWLQMLGRALRPLAGKEKAILIDHTNNWERLGLPSRDRLWSLSKGAEPRISSLSHVGAEREVLEVSIVEIDVELYKVKDGETMADTLLEAVEHFEGVKKDGCNGIWFMSAMLGGNATIEDFRKLWISTRTWQELVSYEDIEQAVSFYQEFRDNQKTDCIPKNALRSTIEWLLPSHYKGYRHYHDVQSKHALAGWEFGRRMFELNRKYKEFSVI